MTKKPKINIINIYVFFVVAKKTRMCRFNNHPGRLWHILKLEENMITILTILTVTEI